ncbi:hypothetical protein ACUT6V_003425 [Vibrio cholerae]|jgi:hypothetical protein|uniref:hypothetical protein n=1 Tax=Vibrio sp. V12_P9A6T4 TaxID=1938667 RepID=UPI000B8EA354|nr:hypothetical protein [Vibrio sp. V12_P9A6T4]OXX55797.1 hypothetical protein B9J80_05160 [Vibrio sp. V12_P9A6T4]
MKIKLFFVLVVTSIFSICTYAATSITSISACSDFSKIGDNPNGDYQITTNLNCDQTIEPLGIFKGTLDGQGHSISGLHVTGTGNVGLFAQLRDATIRKLTLRNISVTGTSTIQSIGVIAGRAHDSHVTEVTIENSTVTAPVKVIHGAGMLAGNIEDSTVDMVTVSNSNLTVAHTSAVGMLFGQTKDSQLSGLTNSNNVLTITSDKQEFVGGIVGNAYRSSLKKIHSSDNRISAQILDKGNVGLLTGQLTKGGTIINAEIRSDVLDVPVGDNQLKKGIAAGYILKPTETTATLSNIQTYDIDEALDWYNPRHDTGILTEQIIKN